MDIYHYQRQVAWSQLPWWYIFSGETDSLSLCIKILTLIFSNSYVLIVNHRFHIARVLPCSVWRISSNSSSNGPKLSATIFRNHSIRSNLSIFCSRQHSAPNKLLSLTLHSSFHSKFKVSKFKFRALEFLVL